MSDVNEILIFGAKSNNLKNLDLSIPRDKLVAVSYTHLTLPTRDDV